MQHFSNRFSLRLWITSNRIHGQFTALCFCNHAERVLPIRVTPPTDQNNLPSAYRVEWMA